MMAAPTRTPASYATAELHVVTMDQETFARRRYQGPLDTKTAYHIQDPEGAEPDSYGRSPDGQGVFWYDTLAELTEDY